MTREGADEHGKVTKGPNYVPPNMYPALRWHGCDCGIGRAHQRGAPGCVDYFSMGG